jgi:8-oxo-dGTP pyrophosphatase MutT (NUDIX family)
MRAVVTAGGTSEPVDDVRVITNLSTGRFGAAIASALARRGLEVTLLAGKALASHPEWVDSRVRMVPFGSTSELDAALTTSIETPPELLFMAAAISDYAPLPAAGKIRSDQDELVITLRRNPKILGTLRARCGVGTFLVGFKLLSGVLPRYLQEVARQMMRRDHLNLVVANDLQELSREEHPLWLMTPEGGALRRTGSKAQVADGLVDFVLRRQQVRWHRSAELSGPPPADPARASAASLLQVAIAAGLLPGTDGNVSHRGSAPGTSWTTPRQVEKAQLGEPDLVLARVEPETRRVLWQGQAKPSIDTAVHARLYRRLPRLTALLHFHEALVLPTATTTFPYPCGTLEEAAEIEEALAQAAWQGRWDGGDFAVELVDHGFLVGLEQPERLAAQWEKARSGHDEHLQQLGAQAPLQRLPVFAGGEIVGVTARFEAGWTGAWSTWLEPSRRRQGLGDAVLDAVDRAGRHAVVDLRCEVLDYYLQRGWKLADSMAQARHKLFGQKDPVVLIPPSLRDDLVPAASVCLLDPARRTVLLGTRRTQPWLGYWAFPGGRVEAGETALAAALRELFEETGIQLEEPRPLRQRTVTAGGERGFSITNFVLPTFEAHPPTLSEELDARWVPLEEAVTLRPMAAGTRRILRGVLQDIAPMRGIL